jgi:hypothetical protein
VQVGVEVALPVVPQAPGVVLEVGAFDARALEHAASVSRQSKARRVVDEGQHVGGHTQVLHDRAAHAAHRRQAIRPLVTLGDEAQQRRIDEQVHLGRMGRLAEDVQHVAHPVTHGVDQVETLGSNAGLVADVVQRVDDKVDRDDVDATAFQADGEGIHGGSSWRMRWISLKK